MIKWFRRRKKWQQITLGAIVLGYLIWFMSGLPTRLLTYLSYKHDISICTSDWTITTSEKRIKTTFRYIAKTTGTTLDFKQIDYIECCEVVTDLDQHLLGRLDYHYPFEGNYNKIVAIKSDYLSNILNGGAMKIVDSNLYKTQSINRVKRPEEYYALPTDMCGSKTYFS